MIKFKDILTEAKWTERKFGDRLPTLEDYMSETYDDKYVSVGWGKYKEKGKEDDENAPTFSKTDSGQFVKAADDKKGDKGDKPEKEPSGKLGGGDFERDFEMDTGDEDDDPIVYKGIGGVLSSMSADDAKNAPKDSPQYKAWAKKHPHVMGEITINGKKYKPITENIEPTIFNPQLEIKAFWDRVKVRQYKREMPKQIIRETIKELDFKDQQAFRAYQSQHKPRPTTKISIGGKETTVDKASKSGGGLLKQTSTDELDRIAHYSNPKTKYRFLKSLGIEGEEDTLKAQKKLGNRRRAARAGMNSEYSRQMAEMGIKPGDTFDGDPIPDEETLNSQYSGLEDWLDNKVDAYNYGASWAQSSKYKKLAKKHEKIKNSDEYKKSQEKFNRAIALERIANGVVKFYYGTPSSYYSSLPD